MKIYFAGKIKKPPHDWRCAFFPGKDRVAGIVSQEYAQEQEPTFLVLDGVRHEYIGPFFVSCDHGCAHGRNQHGVIGSCTDYGFDQFNEHDPIDDGLRHDVFERNSMAICQADLVFAWFGLDCLSAYGTLVELGMARGMKKRVAVAYPSCVEVDDLWFGIKTADWVIHASDPVEGLRRALHLRGRL